MLKSDLLSHLRDTLPLILPANGYQTTLGETVLYGIDVREWEGTYGIQWIDEQSSPTETKGLDQVDVTIDAVGYCDHRPEALETANKMEADILRALDSVSCLAGGKITLEKSIEVGSSRTAVQLIFRVAYQVRV